jgi:rSAM/selenodomain-associated transferase 1
LAHEAGPGTGSRDGVTLGIGVMARAPSSGGKSRLASHLSGTRLCALREALLVDTIEIIEAVPDVAAVLFFTPAEGEVEIRALSPPAWRCVAQTGGDLGVRMRAALEYLLQAPGCEAAVLVGADIPLLAADHIGDARETLAATQGVVLGPADDGGYYLIGMRTVHAELFDGVEWGAASVLTDTLRAADRAGIEARLIRAAYDIDTIDDLHRLERDLQDAPPDLAPRVRAWFSERS